MADVVFALDIGTRKVAGLLLAPVPSRPHLQGYVEQNRILAAEMVEQAPGAMLDGQIHDVRRVATVVRTVKERLEKKAGHRLESAAVAAAGRSLLAARGRARLSLHGSAIADPERIRVLELEAVQNAVTALGAEHGKRAEAFLCVGYSVTGYFLDGEKIGDLYGQRGQEAAIEAIATFLPRLVVESLVAALAGAGLQAASLTLEPIAALNAVVPVSMRQLNLALVDIGAGTSDIAVTQAGTVIGYGMVPLAGDEVTERLMEEFLLDFAEAERLKRSLGTYLGPDDSKGATPATTETPSLVSGPRAPAPLAVTNVLGQRVALKPEEVSAVLKPAVETIAAEVAASIRALNGRPPQAVILVGGGSLTPGIASALARALDLPLSRVATRDRTALPQVSGAKTFTGPQAVTPIGIALSAIHREALEFYEVTVNGLPTRLLQAANATVGEALMAAGFSARSLLGRAGRGLTVEINGRVVTIPGTLGRPALVRLNGRPAALDARIKAGDAIEVGKPEDGADAVATVGEVARLLPETAALAAGDGVVRFHVNGQPLQLPVPPPTVLVNGSPASLSDPVADGDKLYVAPSPSAPTVRDALEKAGAPLSAPIPAINVRVNGSAVALPFASGTVAPPEDVLVNGSCASLDACLFDGADIRVRPRGKRQFILSDLFGHPAFAGLAGRAESAGGNDGRDGSSLVLEVNGQPAGFTTPLHDGDDVTISWREKER